MTDRIFLIKMIFLHRFMQNDKKSSVSNIYKQSLLRYIIIILIISTILISRTKGVYHSEREITFEKWLKNVEDLSLLPTEKGGKNLEELLSNVKISIYGEGETESIFWQLEGKSEKQLSAHPNIAAEIQQQNSKVLRLLALMREANLFSLQPDEKSDHLGTLHVIVEKDGDKFLMNLNQASIADNLPAQNMLRLFKEYSTPTTNYAETKDENKG